MIRQVKILLGKNLSQLVEINTQLGNYEEALLYQRSHRITKDWPYAYVDHMEIESKLYSSQEKLYPALESLDNALKTV